MGNWWLFNPRKWVATTLSMVGLLWFPLSLQAEPIADSFRFPLEGSWSPSRGFAKKFISDWCGFHLADDIPRDSDTPVFPTAKGVVKFEGVVFGYTVVIEHLLSNGSYVTSVYYHMKRPADGGIKLTLGQELDPGATLGFVSGLKKDHGSAPHLHFGIRKGSFRKGKDLRTEKWYYPGYTTIYKGGVRQCNEIDPVHKEITGEWEDPAEFINAQFTPLTQAFLPKTGQTTSYSPGDDGDLQVGVAWPVPRFFDHGNGTITDNLTGLMWPQDANLPGMSLTWQQALDFVKGMNNRIYLNYGYTDWRLPNLNELESLVDIERYNPSLPSDHKFVNVQNYFYWTSSTLSILPSNARIVGLFNGEAGYRTKSFTDTYVWPVRGGQGGTTQLLKTGQSSCYNTSGSIIVCTSTGQDGEYQAGIVPPTPRFVDNGNGTVTDDLIELIWTKDANMSGNNMTWQQALDFVKGMNAGVYPNFGYTNWRLPNRRELMSLVNIDKFSPTLPLSHPFINIINNAYWSSSSESYSNGVQATEININNGAVFNHGKSSQHYVWPVHSGRD